MSQPPSWLAAARNKWRYRGQSRPDFAKTPAAGEESVWDYPRPPELVRDTREALVSHGADTIARSSRLLRVLETASPPTVYLPLEDVDRSCLVPGQSTSMCEWKGEARHFGIRLGDTLLDDVGWEYPDPFEEFAALRAHLSFHPGRLDCTLDGVRVAPQPGGYYGGWLTPEIVGPVKGEPGSEQW